MKNTCALILAAGEGKRMKTQKPKALLEVLRKPMLRWIIDAARDSGILNICVITGFGSERVQNYLKGLNLKKEGIRLSTVFQEERLGTAHAVLSAKNFLVDNNRFRDIAILSGDSPLISSDIITRSYAFHIKEKNSATLISSKVTNPYGYGRIIRKDGKVLAVVEQKDADEETLKIKEVNSGAYWFEKDALISILDLIKNDNAQNEYYLTDAVRLLISRSKKVDSFESESEDLVLGANDLDQLKRVNEAALILNGKT